ncbi:hypothetical protein [Nonomuraea sp. NPDC049709]|uniref:hypothetical protein n=1 Tax=Nonomuraea sp. NPDC049709 TaxID=3154736 RepID=UPI003444BE3B
MDAFGPLVAIAAVISAGDRAFYPASGSYVAALTEDGGRDRLYAMQATARNVAFGLGGLLSASALSLAGGIGFTLIRRRQAQRRPAVGGRFHPVRLCWLTRTVSVGS